MKSLRLSTLGVITWLMMAVTLALLLTMDYSTRQRSQAVNEHWRDFATIQARKSNALIRLQGALGYGGLMHHIKGVLAGPMDNALLILMDDVGRARTALKDYANAGVNPEEARLLGQIEQSLEEFYRIIPDLDRVQKAGRSVPEMVAIMPANEERTKRALFALANEMARSGRRDRVTVAAESAALKEWLQVKMVLLASTMALAMVLLSWFMGGRVLGPLQRTTEALAALRAGTGAPDAPITEHGDEITDLTASLGQVNTRITTLQHQLNRAVTSHLGAGGSSALSEGAKMVKQAGILRKHAREMLDKLGAWREATRTSTQSGLAGLDHAARGARQKREASDKLKGFLGGFADMTAEVQLLSLNMTLAAERGAHDDDGLTELADEVKALSDRLNAFSESFGDLAPDTGSAAGKEEAALLDATEAMKTLHALAGEMVGAASSLAESSLEQADLMRHIGEAVSDDERTGGLIEIPAPRQGGVSLPTAADMQAGTEPQADADRDEMAVRGDQPDQPAPNNGERKEAGAPDAESENIAHGDEGDGDEGDGEDGKKAEDDDPDRTKPTDQESKSG